MATRLIMMSGCGLLFQNQAQILQNQIKPDAIQVGVDLSNLYYFGTQCVCSHYPMLMSQRKTLYLYTEAN